MPDNSKRDPWSQLKAAFRTACSRRIAGDQKGAVRVLQDKVPGLVAAWAKTSDLEPADKKLRLKGLFEDESERAEELAAIFELYAGKFESMVADRVAQRVLKEVRPKLEEIVRDSIVVEVPAPVIPMADPILTPDKPDLEPVQEETEPAEAKDLEIATPSSEPLAEPVSESLVEPAPEVIEEELPEPEVVDEELPEPDVVEEEPSEAELIDDEPSEPGPDPESAQEELELDLESQEKNEEDAPEELDEEEADETAAPGRISFDDIEGMIDNILDQAP